MSTTIEQIADILRTAETVVDLCLNETRNIPVYDLSVALQENMTYLQQAVDAYENIETEEILRQIEELQGILGE